MDKDKFLKLPKLEATKVAWKMLKDKKINHEQFDRLMKAVAQVDKKRVLWSTAVEVFGEEER